MTKTLADLIKTANMVPRGGMSSLTGGLPTGKSNMGLAHTIRQGKANAMTSATKMYGPGTKHASAYERAMERLREKNPMVKY